MIPHLKRSPLGVLPVQYMLWRCSSEATEGWGTTQAKAYAAWEAKANRLNQNLHSDWQWRTDHRGRRVLVR